MPRYRPPAPKKSPYITRAGFVALQAEQQQLWSKRREVVVHLSAAAAEGDRSENAEYRYRKKQLREIDRRIRYLDKRLPELKVVDHTPSNHNQVFFGAWVTLCDTQGKQYRYRIVGADEFDASKNWISIDSPMAHALLKAALDDHIRVELPGGQRAFDVVDITYPTHDAG